MMLLNAGTALNVKLVVKEFSPDKIFPDALLTFGQFPDNSLKVVEFPDIFPQVFQRVTSTFTPTVTISY